MKRIILYSFELLECEPQTSLEEVKRKYRMMVKKYHPDLNGDPEAVKHFRNIQRAYNILEAYFSNPGRFHSSTDQEYREKEPKNSSSHRQNSHTARDPQGKTDSTEDEINNAQQEYLRVKEKEHNRKIYFNIIAIFISISFVSLLFTFFLNPIFRYLSFMLLFLSLGLMATVDGGFQYSDFLSSVRLSVQKHKDSIFRVILASVISFWMFYKVILVTVFPFYLFILFILYQVYVIFREINRQEPRPLKFSLWWIVMAFFLFNFIISGPSKTEVVISPHYGNLSASNKKLYASMPHELDAHTFDKAMKLSLTKMDKGEDKSLILVKYRKSPIGMHIYQDFEYLENGKY